MFTSRLRSTDRNKLSVIGVIVLISILCCSNIEETHVFLRQAFKVPQRVPTYHLPKEQCPKGLQDCSKRVLQRNQAPKWITTWLPSEPEVDVTHLTGISGWKTVLVGDGFCPKGCRFPDCVFLDPASQAILGSSLAPLLPPNDPAKKNLAYLYAIKQQAHFIYDTNVNIRPLHNLSDFFYGNTSGLVYTGKGIFNYYKHYGEHWFYPPGFPPKAKLQNDPSAYILSDISQPEVQYGLVKVKDKSGPRFQPVVPTVFVGSQSFAPFDSSNTLFHRRAFWGLFSFQGPNGDIVRSFCLQTLLKYIHGHVGFVHPNAQYETDSHLPTGNKGKVSQTMMWFMYRWKCRRNANLDACFTQLTYDLLKDKFIREEISLMVNAWLSDLTDYGYKVSEIKVDEPLRLISKTNTVGRRISYKPVQFSPSPGAYYKTNPAAKTYRLVTGMCENFTYPNHVTYQFDDILLIVTFNYAFLYENMIYVESIYRRYFPHILFCGPDVESFRSAVTLLPANSTVAYVSGIERGWMYFQDCTVHAMKMNFNVRGYLQIGEDTLVNPWNLKSLSPDQLWFSNITWKSSRGPEIKEKWYSWFEPYGKKALNMTFNHIESLAKKQGDTMEKQFYKQYLKNVKSFQYMFHQTCDFFYIPDRLKDRFIYFTKLFFNSTLLVEAAIPTMILGLDEEANIARLAGKISWGGARNFPRARFSPKSHYLHAFKGMAQMKLPNCKSFMCDVYLPTLVNRMANSSDIK